MHGILAKIDDLDTAITDSSDLSFEDARALGFVLAGFRTAVWLCLPQETPAFRPDLANAERARQAAAQGDADRGGYLPVKTQLEAFA